jgi:SAM-dependent methyltransferase
VREGAPTNRGGSADAPFVSYAQFSEAEGQFRAEMRKLMDGGARRFCDIGGGHKSVIGLHAIRERGLEYVVLDESPEQIDRTPFEYSTYLGSVLDAQAVAELVREHGPFDAVVSHFVAEHIPDGRRFHENVFGMLRPGGHAVHLFPTLYALPFVINRLLPVGASQLIAYRVGKADKFRAYYSWCRGPSRAQIERLQAIGYSIDRYVGFFGHSFYARIKPLHLAQRTLTRRLLEHPHPSATSAALVVLTRPH